MRNSFFESIFKRKEEERWKSAKEGQEELFKRFPHLFLLS